jgi:hypothetical protein
METAVRAGCWWVLTGLLLPTAIAMHVLHMGTVGGMICVQGAVCLVRLRLVRINSVVCRGFHKGVWLESATAAATAAVPYSIPLALVASLGGNARFVLWQIRVGRYRHR